MSNSRELSELASKVTVNGDVVSLSGNVGVGVTDAVSPLTVRRASGAISALQGVTSAASTLSGYLAFQNAFATTADGTALARIGFGTGASTGAGFLSFETSSGSSSPAERMRIDSAGNVGIGRTPTYRLDLEASSATDITTLVRNTNASFCSAYVAVNDLGTKFGAIGVVNSSSTLGPNYGTPGEVFIRASTSADGLVLTSVNSSGYIRFQVASAERMRIDSAGNVGVGITPAAGWHSGTKAIQIGTFGAVSCIISTGYTELLNNCYNTTATNYAYISSNAAGKYSQQLGKHVWSNAVSGTAGGGITFVDRMTLNASGNLGIGIDPTTRLDVLGSARIRNGGLATGLILGADYNATTTTDATIKAGQIIAPHYTNAEEPVGIIRAFVDATSSTVSIGSGSGALNNVTVFDVYLGSSNTTTGGNVRFAIKNDGIVFTSQLAPDAVDATATLTTANLSKKIITSTTAAAVTGTLPTGTLMDGTFGTVTDLCFEWAVINTGPNAFTLAVETGHTIVGNATVATNTSGTFKSRRTGAATWISYRI